MTSMIKFLLISCLLYTPLNSQKRIREKGESDYPYLVNMWIPKNAQIKQTRSRFCDGIQLTPYTDYFFTSAKCFDNLEHGMWLEDIGISWDEHVVSYSRHMSFLTRYREEGGHFVILERYEISPSDTEKIIKPMPVNISYSITEQFGPEKMKESQEIEDMSSKSKQNLPLYQLKDTTKRTENVDSSLHNTKDFVEDYEDFPPDLIQFNNFDENFEIKKQIVDDPSLKVIEGLRNKKVKLGPPNILGATECYVLGWGTFLKDYHEIKDLDGLLVKKEIVHKISRKACRTTDPAHICVAKRDDRRECVEDLGSPLICEQKDIENGTVEVSLVGIYTGFKNCGITENGIFRSLSADLAWIARWAKGIPITSKGFASNTQQPRIAVLVTEMPKIGPIIKRRRRGRSGPGCSIKTSETALFWSYTYYIIVIFFQF